MKVTMLDLRERRVPITVPVVGIALMISTLVEMKIIAEGVGVLTTSASTATANRIVTHIEGNNMLTTKTTTIKKTFHRT